MKKIYDFFRCFLIFALVSVLFGCMSVPKRNVISRHLTAKPVISAEGLAAYFIDHEPDCDAEKVKRLAEYYIQEAGIEGINSDCAWAQMCLETGYLKYGNLVQPEWNNFCGLGAMDAAHPGEVFETEQLGVRAHIQHLQAYATTADVPLKQDLVDPRYSWPHKAKFAETVYDLAGTWAVDKLYGDKINAILDRMEFYK